MSLQGSLVRKKNLQPLSVLADRLVNTLLKYCRYLHTKLFFKLVVLFMLYDIFTEGWPQQALVGNKKATS